jgi:hypothetical protein
MRKIKLVSGYALRKITVMQDNQASQYQNLPEFQTYLWFLAQWSNFQTAFLVACNIAEDQSEQDEVRPILQSMVEQYMANKSAGTLLNTYSFWAWWKLNQALEKIQSRHAEAWLNANIINNAA